MEKSITPGKKDPTNHFTFLKFIATVAVILFFTSVKANTFYSKANAAWNVNTTWSNVGYGGADATGFPVSGDIVNIGNGYTISASANATCASLTIDAGGTLTPTGTATVNATTGITINGTYTNQSTGAITTPSWTCNGTYNHATSSATLPLGSASTTWAAGSNLNITGSYTTQTVLINFVGQTFGNFTFNPSTMTSPVALIGAAGTTTIQGNFTITQTGSSTLYMRISGTIFASTLNINGNFTLTAGTYDLHNGGATATDQIINLKGNFTISGTSVLTESTTQSGSTVGFNFTGTGTQTVNIAPTSSITSQGTTATCAIMFTVASGSTIDLGTSILTGTNNTSFTLSPGASIITANTGGLAASGATGSIEVSGVRNFSTTANYTYNGTSAQVTGTGLPATVNNLTITNSAGVTLTAGATVNGTLALGSGSVLNLTTFTLNTNTLTIGGITQSTGSYGGSGSGATNILSNFGAGTGKVLAGDVPPTNLTYTSPNTFPTGIAITPLSPTVTGTVDSYSVSPALPTGLSLNTTSGIISGTPSVNASSATYTVTATNTGGSTTFGIVIGVGSKRYAVNASPADWNVTSTWSLTSGGASGAPIPVAGDAVYIGDAAVGRRVTIPSGYVAACDSLFIGNSGNSTANNLTLSASDASLNVTGDLVINRSGGGNTNALNVNAGTVVVSGSVTLAGTNTSTSRINTIVITTGTLTIAGNLTFITSIAANNVITMSGGAGTLNLAGAFNATAGTLTPGTTSTFNYNGSNQTVTDISLIVYNHLILSGSGTKTLMAGMSSIAGNLTLSGTTTATTVANLAIGGNLTIGTGCTFATGSNFTLGVTGATSITGTLTLAGTGAKTFTGNVTLNMGGVWNETGIASLNFAGNLTNNATFTANTGTHTFTGTTKTLSGTAAIVIPTIVMTGTYSNAGTLTCSTAFSGGGGTLTQATTGLLNLGGTFTINNLSATATGNTVTYYGGVQTVKTGTYYNLTLSGTGVKTTTSVTVNNVLSMEGSGNASTAPTYGGGATLQYNTTSPLTAGAEWISPFVATGGVLIKNTGVITMNGNKTFNASIPLAINANASLTTNNNRLTFGGNFTNAGTFTAGSSQIAITNTMASQSISGFTTTGSVSMTKTAGTATLQGNVSGSTLTVSGSGGTLHLGTGLVHTFSGTITLTAGILNGGSSTLNENATSTTAWNGTGTVFTAGTGTVVFGGVAQTLATATTFYNLTFTNSGLKTLTGAPTITNVLSMEGTATVTGTPVYGSSATLQYKGSGAQTTGTEFVTPFNGSGGVKINNSTGVTLGSARSMGSNPFTIGDIIPNSLFSDGGFQLTATGTLNLTSGTYTVKYTSFPAFTTTNIVEGTTVDYAATATQTVKGITYSNLTMSGTGTNSKISDGNITVNGILNLNSANASSTQGCLDMNSTPYTLTMGATATTTGTGDVTGIVTRTSFAINTSYSFGNQFTTLNMAAGGTLPGSVSVKIFLTSTHTWKTDAINRYYDIAQTGGTSGTLTTMNLHYLAGELNGNTEGNLDLFDYHVSGSLLHDHGRSNFSTTDKWVGLTNRAITYIAPGTGFSNKYWTLGNSTAASFTWLGATDTDWTKADNWTGGVPGSADAVTIPDATTTDNDPTLPASTTIGLLNIQAGGILNGGSSTVLTISGGTGAWNNLGTFNAGTSTVIFTSSTATMADPTNFYNVTVANGANLTLESNNVMRIAGILSLSSTGVLNAANNNNTVEYNGAAQTVVFPNGSTTGYSSLILSGSGTKTMPTTAMTVYGGFTTAGTASVTAGNTLNIIGNVTLGSGTTFAASTFNHTVTGNWTNNGATFTPDTGTITFNNTSVAQILNGTVASQTFNNLTIAKTSQTLNVGGSTTSLTVNDLTETSGNFTAPATLTINGNALLTAGTFLAGATTNLYGNLTNNGATFTAGTGVFNLNGASAITIGGTSSNTFNNLTVNNTAGVTASADQTVSGTLNLPVANPSSIKGSLDMGSNTLTMGLNATNTGIGDVTGIVKRQHVFTGNIQYTFGNTNTNILFLDVPGAIKPVWISCKITIGTVPGWRGQAINRVYSFAQDGTGTDRTATRLHYLDAELHGTETDETKLVFWDAYSGPGYSNTFPRGKSNYNSTDNWIGLAGMAINFIAPNSTLDYKQWGLAYTNVSKITWTGNGSPTYAGDWSLPGNWDGGVPTATDDVLIPSTLPGDTHGYPNRNLSASTVPAVAGTLEIDAGATLTVDNYNITVTGSTGAWLNNGTFIPGTGNVIFNHNNLADVVTMGGTTNFYNLTFGINTDFRPNTGSYIGILGSLITNASSVAEFSTTNNTVEFKGVNQTILNPTGLGSNLGYYHLVLSSSGTATFPAQLNVSGNLTVNSTIDVSTNNSSLVFSGSSAQTISGTSPIIFNNVQINNPAGVTGSNDMTVNGALTFISDNPASNDKGALDMAITKILDMGVNSSTTGPGEVSGIIRRAHSFATETSYTFGDEYNTLTFAAKSGQTLPTSVSLKVTIGTAPDWSANLGATISNPIRRLYGITQTGGTGTRALMQVHYRENEIPSEATESNLTIWTCSHISGNYYNKESGRSGYNIGMNYITIQDVDFVLIPSVWGDFNATLAPMSATKRTWIGTISTDWTEASNWTPNGVPDTSQGAIIPNTFTTTFAPELPATGSCISVQIEAGGVLNAPASGGTFTITGADASWSIGSGGAFNANTSTLLFNANSVTDGNVATTGSTNFYNLTIASGTLLRPSANSYMQIEGTLTNNGILEAATNENIIEFNGSSTQGIPNPNGSTPGYHNLILSGSGTKNLPSTLNIVDEFINNTSGIGTVVTGSGTVIFDGNSIYGQTINGTTSTTFNNLTIDNPTNTITVGSDMAVDGTLNITSGSLLDMGTNILTGTLSSTTGVLGTLKTQNASAIPLPTGETWTFGVVYNNGATPQTVSSGTYSVLQISNPAGTATSGPINSTALILDNGSTLDMGTYELTGGTTISGTGTLKTQNVSATPIPGGKTWPGTVVYNASAGQTAVAGTFGNMSIDNAAGVTLTDNTTVNGTLLINSGSLIVNTGARMTAQQITNNADVTGIIIKSSSSQPNGTLIFNNAQDNPVSATVEMYSKAFWDLSNVTPGGKYKWQFFGIPVSTLVASPMFDGDYVRQFNEAGNGTGYTADKRWIQLVNTSTLTPFTGYEITQPAGSTYTFQGQLINSDFSQSLSYTTGSDYPGEHLLSNPYAAAIDITKLVFGNDLDKTVYLYNMGSMADWTGQSGLGVNPGQYISAPQATAGSGGIPGQIPSMQGFLILMNTTTPTATTFSIPYSSVATSNQDLQRVRAVANTDRIFTRIDISGTRFSDKMWVFTDPTCTRGYDNGWDGSKFFGTTLAPQLWAMETSGNYQVDGVNDINNTYLGFIKGEDTHYKMTITHENLYSHYTSLYLIDSLENTITDITETGTTYSFSADQASQPNRRFKIVTSNQQPSSVATIAGSNLKVFSSGSTVYVQNSSDLKGEIMIYDMTGKTIQKNNFSANGITTIPTALTPGSYLVKGFTLNQKFTQALIIR